MGWLAGHRWLAGSLVWTIQPNPWADGGVGGDGSDNDNNNKPRSTDEDYC